MHQKRAIVCPQSINFFPGRFFFSSYRTTTTTKYPLQYLNCSSQECHKRATDTQHSFFYLKQSWWSTK